MTSRGYVAPADGAVEQRQVDLVGNQGGEVRPVGVQVVRGRRDQRQHVARPEALAEAPAEFEGLLRRMRLDHS